ncbi:hypothetical protein BVX93_01540 [bacterium B13(2017)]|nr:hypothetical protein BVX93_01540 [bacterium B13(2017)]
MYKQKYPIILAHGIARFDVLTNSILKFINRILCERSIDLDNLHYFKGMRSFFKHQGYEVYSTNVAFAKSIVSRAEELKQEVLKILNKSQISKVHIIAHSMGGLDARYMIANDEELANKIVSLTTIGTPHLGTSFADWGLEHGGDTIIKKIQSIIDLGGYRDLTTKACEELNSKLEDKEANNSVIYQTYASYQKAESIMYPFDKSWKIIYDKEGDNDGLVSIISQKWKDKIIGKNGVIKQIKQNAFPVLADHFNQVGWWNIFQLRRIKWWQQNILKEKNDYEQQIKNIYLEIVKRLDDFF